MTTHGVNRLQTQPIQSNLLAIAVALGLQLAICRAAPGQVVNQATATNSAQADDASEEEGVTTEAMIEQITRLNAASFRVRQAALSQLQLHPKLALDAIAQQIEVADPNLAGQLVNLLSGLATHSSVQVSQQAQQVLQEMSRQPTYAGLLATNTISVIADVQERQAMKKLMLEGARIDERAVTLHNLTVRATDRPRVLELNPNFQSSEDCLLRISALNSVDTVILDSIVVDEQLASRIASLKQLRYLKLREVEITADALQCFRDATSLEYLEISYVNVDDSILPVLETLPVSRHVRLYGTRVTEKGAEQLAKALDSVEVYRGKGGFLGVGTLVGNNTVSRVVPFSAADLAGIRTLDKLTHIDGASIANFEDLRRELGKFRASDKLMIRLERDVDGKVEELEVEVKLGKEQRDG